jgi:biotin transport system substrate-specific component
LNFGVKEKSMVYVDSLRLSARRRVLYDFAWVVGGSLFIALCARIAVFLPFSPVPVTGQTLAVLLTGALLGSRRGPLSVMTYLAAGTAGLPFFAGGAVGFARLAGPTGGYLMGFVLAAFVTGLLAERGWDRRVPTTVLLMGVGTVVVYAFGLAWLAKFVGPDKVLALGLYPFLLGEVAKVACAVVLLPSAWRLSAPEAVIGPH